MNRLLLRILIEHHLHSVQRLLTEYKPMLEVESRDALNRRIIAKALPTLLTATRRIAPDEYDAAFPPIAAPRRVRRPSHAERTRSAVEHVQRTEGLNVRAMIQDRITEGNRDFDVLDGLTADAPPAVPPPTKPKKGA